MTNLKGLSRFKGLGFQGLGFMVNGLSGHAIGV